MSTSLEERFPDQLRLLGAIVAAWNVVEYTLAVVIAIASGSKPTDVYRQAMSVVGNRERLRALRMAVLASQRHTDLLVRRQQLEQLLDEAEACLTLRNTYAHAVLGTADLGAPENSLVIVPTKLGKGEKPRELSAELLQRDLKRIRDLERRVMQTSRD